MGCDWTPPWPVNRTVWGGLPPFSPESERRYSKCMRDENGTNVKADSNKNEVMLSFEALAARLSSLDGMYAWDEEIEEVREALEALEKAGYYF